MKVYPLLVNGIKKYNFDNSLDNLSYINSFSSIIDSVKKGQLYLKSLSVDDIIGCLSQLIKEWLDRKSAIQKKYPDSGINYLIYYFKQSNLEEICNLSLRGDRHVLDDYTSIPLYNVKLLAQPKGIVCHWLSGNIPILGIISAVQGLLTKNANIIKISKHTKFLIPDLLSGFNNIKFTNSKGKVISGREILKSMAIIYFDKDDKEAQKQFSTAANIRVAWGGKEAVESIVNLQRNYDCDDIILGPKTSFVVVGKEFLDTTQHAEQVAKKIAQDASLYEQRGCNSPHTVFVEKGKITAGEFSSILAKQLADVSKLYPLKQIEIADAQRIILERAKYDMLGKAFYPTDLQWSVLYSDNTPGLATPCFNRTLFIKPVRDIFEVAKYCTIQTQSVGTALSLKRKEKFAKTVSDKGVSRCPDVGMMLFYDTPWDGMFIMDRFVRWSRL